MSRRVVGVLTIALLLAATLATVPGGAQETQTPQRLVVDPDGEGYDSITPALAAATDGDTIEVRPGTYEEELVVNKSVELIAPDGATLEGTTLSGATTGIRIVGDASPEIVGFDVVGYQVGVDAAATSGDWALRESRIHRSRVVGVRAADSTGDWRLIDTVVSATDGVGVGAFRSSGNWSLVSVTIRDTAGVGVNARYASGDWLVTTSDIGPTTNGTALPSSVAGAAIVATQTTGEWAVRQSAIHNSTRADVDATGAVPAGVATGDWWGDDGPDCVGNVSCTSPLAARPPAAGAPNATSPADDGGDSGGGGLPTVLLAGVGLIAVAVGGTAIAVRTMGRNAVIDRIEAVLVVLIGVADLAVDVATSVLPVGGGSSKARRIVLANVDSETVTCRVRCRTGEGVQFEYDLRLDPDERREARELPGDRPFEITVQVDGGSDQQTFESPTDVVVKVAGHGVEIDTP